MDRFYFDLQRFATNIVSGKSDSEPHEIKDDGSALNLTNVGSYVKIIGTTMIDSVLSTGSHNVTVDAQAHNDTVLISATKYASINGGDGADSIDLFSSNYVTVEGGAGADVINVSDSDSVYVDGGDDADTITISDGSKNVTVTTGNGSDVIKISSDSKNVVLTDLGDDDTIVLTDLTEMPRFATYNGNVLNLDGVKVTLSGSDFNSDTTTTKITFGDGTGATRDLKKLLKVDPPLWNATKNKTVATYSTARGQLLASLSGLKSFGTAYTNASDIPGITVDVDNNIILSNDVLKNTNVILDSKDFKLALDDEEIAFNVTGLAVTGADKKVKTAKYTTKAKSNGYYLGDDGKKLKYLKANATATTFTVGNLATTTATVAAGGEDKIDGVDFDIKGNTGSVTISDADAFADVTTVIKKVAYTHKKATIDGEDVKFILTSGVDSLEVVGGKNDENIVSSGTNVTLSTAGGNDWVYDYGKTNKIDLGAGNDYIFGEYSTDTVLAGAGNDYIQVSGEANTVLAAAGNDTIEIAGGTNNTINADTNNDFIFFNDTDSTVTETTILAGKGNDIVSVIGGGTVTSEDSSGDVSNVYNFKSSTIDLGEGDDEAYISFVSDTSVIASAGKNNVNFSGIGSTISLGSGVDIVEITDASDTAVYTGAGNDKINVVSANYLTFDGGAGADVVEISSASEVDSSTFVMGAGADSVSIIGGAGKSNLIETGADNDFILISDTSMTNSTISTGFSNVKDKKTGYGDVISIVGGDDYEGGNTIYYGYGTGNDTIYGFTAKDRLFIAQSDFDSSTAYTLGTVTLGSGSATVEKATMVLTVGTGTNKGTITLVDFADTATTNINSGEALDSQIVWSVSAGKATGKLNGTTIATITGLKVATGTNDEKKTQNAAIAAAIHDDGNVIMIDDAALDSSTAITKAITLDKTGGNNGYKLALGEVTASKPIPAQLSIENGTADFGTVTDTEGYVLEDDGTITYTTKTSKVGPVINGLPTSLTTETASGFFEMSGSTVILSAGALPTYTFTEGSTDTGITIAGDYTLALGDGVAVSKPGETGWKFSVDPVDSTDTSLTMRASYDSAYTNKGYYLTNSDKGISWRPETESNTLLTVSGLKVGTKADDLVVNTTDKTVTIPKTALATKAADQPTIYLDTDDEYADYKLALGKGITAAKLTAEGFKVSGTTAYYQTRKIAKNGYALSEDGKSLDYYTDDDGDNTVFTLTGVKNKAATSAMTFSREERDIDEDGKDEVVNVIKLTGAALGTTDVSLEVSENYTEDDEGNPIAYAIELDSAVKAPVYTKDAGWETVKGGLHYVTAKNTAGFTLNASSDTVVYTAANAGKTVVNITGLTGMTTDTTTVSVSGDGVTLKTAKIVEPGRNALGASIVGAGYAYRLDGDGGRVVYNKGTGIQITGSDGKDSLVGGAYKDTLNGGKGDDSLSGGAGNDLLEGGEGDDTLLGGNGNDTLIGESGTNNLLGGNGNDTFMLNGGTNVVTGGAGKDVFFHTAGTTTITDYAAGVDTIKVDSIADIEGKMSLGENRKDVVFTFDTGTITVENGKNKFITLTTDGTAAHTVKKKITAAGVTAGLIADEDNLITADNLSNIVDSDLIGEFENYDSNNFNKQENLVTYGE